VISNFVFQMIFLNMLDCAASLSCHPHIKEDILESMARNWILIPQNKVHVRSGQVKNTPKTVLLNSADLPRHAIMCLGD